MSTRMTCEVRHHDAAQRVEHSAGGALCACGSETPWSEVFQFQHLGWLCLSGWSLQVDFQRQRGSKGRELQESLAALELEECTIWAMLCNRLQTQQARSYGLNLIDLSLESEHLRLKEDSDPCPTWDFVSRNVRSFQWSGLMELSLFQILGLRKGQCEAVLRVIAVVTLIYLMRVYWVVLFSEDLEHMSRPCPSHIHRTASRASEKSGWVGILQQRHVGLKCFGPLPRHNTCEGGDIHTQNHT